MALFIQPDAYEIINPNPPKIVPVRRLLNQSYIVYFQNNILHEKEKNKLYSFFIEQTKNSSKAIKRIKFNYPDIDDLKSRIITQFNTTFVHKNGHKYAFNRILPMIEIINWPADREIDEKFNQLTRGAYITKDENTIIGTFIIPLIKTKTSTLFVDVNEGSITVVRCECDQKCLHDKCPCAKVCKCDEPVKAHVTEDNNLFYMSELEPIEIYGDSRLNLYVHIEYSLSTR